MSGPRPRTPSVELVRLVDHWTWLRRLARAARWILPGASLGLIAGLIPAAALLARSSLLPAEYARLLGGTAGVGAALAGLVALAWPVSRLAAARRFDRELGLAERLSTALELIPRLGPGGEGESGRLEAGAAGLYRLQVADALSTARGLRPFRRLRPWPGHLAWLGFALLLLGSILLGLIARPAFLAAGQARQFQAGLAQEQAQIERQMEAIRLAPDLNDEQRQALQEPLQAAAEALSQARTAEQAGAALQEAARELRRLEAQAAAQSLAEAQSQGLREAGASLDLPPGDPLESFSQALASGDPAAASAALAALDPAVQPAESLPALAAGLQQAAAALEQSAPAAAGALAQAAQAIQEGDPAAAGEAIRQAAGSLAAGSQQQAQAARAAAGALEQAGQALAQAGAAGGSSQPAGPEPEGGSGAGRGSPQQAAAGGPPAGSEPLRPSNGPGDGGLVEPGQSSEQVYVPDRLGVPGENPVELPGGAPGDAPAGSAGGGPPLPAQSQVPYTDVLPGYIQAYRQAVENGQIPLAYQEIIRKYFSDLEP